MSKYIRKQRHRRDKNDDEVKRTVKKIKESITRMFAEMADDAPFVFHSKGPPYEVEYDEDGCPTIVFPAELQEIHLNVRI